MTSTLETKEFVFAAIQAERNGEQFPISLDDVWQKLGYSNKRNAKRRLEQDLTENVDFALLISEQWSQDGRLSDSIGLSLDGYKHFCK